MKWGELLSEVSITYFTPAYFAGTHVYGFFLACFLGVSVFRPLLPACCPVIRVGPWPFSCGGLAASGMPAPGGAPGLAGPSGRLAAYHELHK